MRRKCLQGSKRQHEGSLLTFTDLTALKTQHIFTAFQVTDTVFTRRSSCDAMGTILACYSKRLKGQ